MDTNTTTLPRSIMLYAVDAIPITYTVSYQSRYNVLDGHINSLFYKKYPVNHSIVLLRCFMANSSNSKVEFIAHSTSTKTSCNLFIDFFTDSSSTTTPDPGYFPIAPIIISYNNYKNATVMGTQEIISDQYQLWSFSEFELFVSTTVVNPVFGQCIIFYIS